MTIGVILLAGGEARRFGDDKRLALLTDGRPMIQVTIDNILAAGLPLLVCLGGDDRVLASALQAQGIRCRQCPDAGQGMGATLANGIAGVEHSWRGALVALADMPWIRPATYRQVRDRLAPGGIVVPRYRSRRGHPVGFDAAWYPQLAALSGDRGARTLLAAHPEAVTGIEVDDAGVLADVDVPADLLSPAGTNRAQ